MKYTQSNMDTWWIFDPGVCVTICIQLWQFGSIWEISRGDQQHFEGINLQDPSTMSQLSHSVNRGQAPKRYHRSSHQMSSCICCCTVIFGCFECSCKWVCSFCVQTFSVKNKWEVDNIIPPTSSKNVCIIQRYVHDKCWELQRYVFTGSMAPKTPHLIFVRKPSHFICKFWDAQLPMRNEMILEVPSIGGIESLRGYSMLLEIPDGPGKRFLGPVVKSTAYATTEFRNLKKP